LVISWYFEIVTWLYTKYQIPLLLHLCKQISSWKNLQRVFYLTYICLSAITFDKSACCFMLDFFLFASNHLKFRIPLTLLVCIWTNWRCVTTLVLLWVFFSLSGKLLNSCIYNHFLKQLYMDCYNFGGFIHETPYSVIDTKNGCNMLQVMCCNSSLIGIYLDWWI